MHHLHRHGVGHKLSLLPWSDSWRLKRLHRCLKTLFLVNSYLFHTNLCKHAHASLIVAATKPPYVPDVHHLTVLWVNGVLTNEATHHLKCLQFMYIDL